MAASIWSGYLTFGLISLPVRLHAGARGNRISFHMLHRDDNVRVKQQLICPEDNRVVERSEIVKGYEYRKGEYVIIEPEEIKKIEPKTAKSMEILQFVKSEEVDPIYFESSYHLTADEGGQRPYALLSRAMRDQGYLAIAKVTMHNREYTAFIRPHKDGLMLHTMYYQDEVRDMESYGTESVEVREAELKVANQLIEALADKFEPERFHDTYEENLKKLIDARLEGQDVSAVEKEKKPAPVVDLMEALKQSLNQMGGKKPKEIAAEAQKASEVVAIPKKGPQKAKPRRGKAA